MIVLSAVTALALLALVTQAGIIVVQRSFPPQGRMIEVEGATLHVVDIGPRRKGTLHDDDAGLRDQREQGQRRHG